MRLRRIAIETLAGLVGVAVLAAVAAAQEPPRPDQLVDALNGVFGNMQETAPPTPRAPA